MAQAQEVGSAVIKLTFDGKSLNASIGKIDRDIESNGKKSGEKWGSAWSVAAGNLLSKGIEKIIGVINSSMDTAVRRVDTLANSSVVFSAMGYEADAVSESMGTLNNYLDGLPTSMTDAVQGVQALSAAWGGIEKGTEAFVDLNTAGLAFGASADQVANAITQIGQLDLNGPLDAQTWNSLRNSGFGPVFAAMAKEAGITVGELKESFGALHGTKTVNDFLGELHKLSTEGGAGMQSLESLARANTEGISTAMENMKNRTGKAVASVLDEIGQKNISGLINSASSLVLALTKDGVDTDAIIMELTKQLGEVVNGLTSAITKMAPRIAKILPRLINNIIDIIAWNLPILIDAAINGLIQIIEALTERMPLILESVVDAIYNIIEVITNNLPAIISAITSIIIAIANALTQPRMLSTLLQAGLLLFMSLVQAIPQIIEALYGALPDIIENIVTFLTDPTTISTMINAAVQLFMGIVKAVPRIVGALVGAFSKLLGDLWNAIKDKFTAFGAKFGKAIGNAIAHAINGVIGFIESVINGPIKAINGLLDVLNAIPGVDIKKLSLISLPRVALAEGGVATRATTAVIGEAGKEAVIPLEQNTGNWAGLLAHTLAEEFQEQGETTGTINVYFNNQINSKLDIDEVNRELLTALRRAA